MSYRKRYKIVTDGKLQEKVNFKENISKKSSGNSKSEKTKFRINHVAVLKSIYFILGFLLAFSFIWNFANADQPKVETQTAEFINLTDSVPFQAVFVRTETPIEWGGNGILSYVVPDGGKVISDSVIAKIYANEADVSTANEISTLNGKLDELQKIVNPGTKEVANPVNLTDGIYKQYKDIIFSLNSGQFSHLNANSEELRQLISTKNYIVGKKAEFETEISEIQQTLASLRSPTLSGQVKSPYSGYFVSHIDGFEDVLKAENIDKITAEEIQKAVETDSSEAFKNADSPYIGKIISDYTYYIMGVVENSQLNDSPNIGSNSEVFLKFNAVSSQIKAKVVQVKAIDDNRSILIFTCSEHLADFAKYRTLQADLVKNSYEGLRIPKDAVRFGNFTETIKNAEGEPVIDPLTGEKKTQIVQKKGVYVRVGENIVFRKINQIFLGEDYLISAMPENSDELGLYDEIIIKGVGAEGVT